SRAVVVAAIVRDGRIGTRLRRLLIEQVLEADVERVLVAKPEAARQREELVALHHRAAGQDCRFARIVLGEGCARRDRSSARARLRSRPVLVPQLEAPRTVEVARGREDAPLVRLALQL